MIQVNAPLTSNPAADNGSSAKRADVTDPGRPTRDTSPEAKPEESVSRPKLRVPGWTLAIGGVLIAAATYLYVPSLFAIKTDDASFQANTVSVMPKVAAYVSVLHVTDNSSFTAGELLVELDPRDFQAAVDMATASLQSAQAAQANVEAQLAEQNQVIASDAANLDGDRSALAFAQQQLKRYQQLADDGSGTVQRSQQAVSDFADRQAALQRDTAILAAAQAQSEVLRTQVEEAKANIARAQAALDQAKLNLSYTKIYAPTAGTVASRSVQVGDFVQPGQNLFFAVPKRIYIFANYKETQLTHMRVGQPVSISVDAFPNHTLHGHIESFQRGTGSNFALLPPENATGNFVKIVQRVPVKIVIDDFDNIPGRLGPGMSVETTVTIRPPPRWLAWLL
ncbi:HlyD family secretion protein [Bradyrhizobium sp. SK17]|uniref:HlyD family secretion protein n=1 Tax=Bradyrhizobium sp. SK17 TaxID=2057741 RepID=UPI0012FD8658|nr:HlyD family secretion protein [Bradyrhizobium sp. SK17]